MRKKEEEKKAEEIRMLKYVEKMNKVKKQRVEVQKMIK